ncbi:hypothetical protein EAF04_006297 [Stromatinia cepivora]|nr:hypothetical protein EAF04_006297 [Stromatinia cepivora]
MSRQSASVVGSVKAGVNRTKLILSAATSLSLDPKADDLNTVILASHSSVLSPRHMRSQGFYHVHRPHTDHIFERNLSWSRKVLTDENLRDFKQW